MKWIGQHIYDYVATFRQGVTMDSTLAVTGNTTLSGNLTFDSVALTGIQTSSESFVDNDVSLMTSAAIADKIEAYGYSTTTGDITGVVLTADDTNTVSDTGGSADFTIAGANGVTTSVDGTDFVVGGSNASTSAKGVVELATTAETTTGTDTARAVTPDGLKDGYQGSANINTLGTITTGEWNGDAIVKTYIDSDQRNIAQVGTITTGVWNGTAIASAYLDADTAHLTGAQTVTGVKTIGTNVKLQFRDANAYINSPDSNDIEIAATDITLDAAGTIKLEGPVRPTGQLQYTYHNFTDDIDTTKIYLSLADADTEGTATTAIKLPFTAPLAGKLMRIFLRANQNLSTKTLTWRLETQATGVTFGDGPTIVGTQSGAGCTTTSMTTYDFTSSLDSGDNIIDAGDVVYLSIQSDATTSNTKFYVTCLWEWDMSSIG
tara:strand:+ start:1643 stop:2944 length:1302 start_codon:yes stop_codon:yes gene_type:complete